MGFSKSKRNNGAWCVLLVGLLLAAAAKGDCPDECEVYRGVDRAKYVECIHWCHFGAHPQLKRFASGDASKASKWSSAVLAAELNKGMHNAPAWTTAPQIHVGGADEVEERGKKMVVCRAKLLPGGDPASSPKKHEKSTAKGGREERDWLR
jgi:hypothetical protein